MSITDEMLIAYVDGEADEATRAAVEAAAKADKSVADRIARQRELAGRLSAAFGGALSEPVPERLSAAVERGATDKVVDLQAAKAKRLAGLPLPAWAAMAACLVVGVLVGQQMSSLGPVGRDFRAQGQLAQALDQRLSSDEVGADVVRVGLSFRSSEGNFCRIFQTPGAKGLAGFACRDGAHWRVMMAMEQPVQDAEYRTASALPIPVMRAAQSMLAGDVLDAESEARARAGGWK